MVKVEQNSDDVETSNSPAEPIRRSPRRSTSPQKQKRTIKIVRKTASTQNGQKNGEEKEKNKKRKKKSPKKVKIEEDNVIPRQEPVDPNAPLQMSLPTKAQKRRALRNNIKVEESDDVQDARRREKERLERLEKLRQNTTTTAASYESVPSTSNQNSLVNFIETKEAQIEDTKDPCLLIRRPSQENVQTEPSKIPTSDEFSAFEEKSEDDEVILECIVQKPQIEVVDLSSDDEDQTGNGRRLINAAYVKGVSNKKYTSPQRQEELRVRRLKRAEETMDRMDVTAEGFLLVNEGKPREDPEVYISKHLTKILQPHQLGGIRFLYDNVIEALHNFNPNAGFGCILAHSMGLGKSIQVIAFTEIFFRVTSCKRALIICPVNVIQNWQQEFDKWLPMQEGMRDFPVFLLGDLVKSQASRLDLVSNWTKQGGILLLGYEMFRLLTIKRRRRKENEQEASSSKDKKELSAEEASEAFYQALVDPGPDLIVCDEGHRIKNLKTDVARALSDIKTRRRIVLTGYPLQNNLLEYYCMVDFVRPAYLGSKKHFQLMFDRPIKNGMCIDSTKRDIKIARQRTHVLASMLRGFVQRRTHHLLKKILPDNLEYVVILRKTPIQKNLYKEFVKFIQKELTGEDAAYYNPLKAHAVCSKIWNHPDLLYKAWERQLELLDYTDLANAVDAAEGKILNNQTNGHNGLEMAPPPTSNFQFNPQFPNNVFNMMTSPQQAMSQFGGGSFPAASTSMTLQQNFPHHWQNQFMTPPPSNQMSSYSPMMQSPNSNFTNPNTPASTFEMSNGNLKRKQESVNEISEFNNAAKKKRPGKKKLVQLITDDDEGGSIPYYWADPFMGDYMQGVLENSHKTIVAMQIIRETVKRGEKILLFSTSLLTLSLIEDFLRMHGSIELEDGVLEWKKNVNYFRFDGSTSGVERERLISQFNSDPTIRLFLISTRAGSLGINLVSASRILIMDCSWNPCHDAQAVCRIYRYGQKNKTYIYRLIMHNCMERSIFARQISKHGLQQRVVDEQLIDANVTQKELENLIAYDEIQDMDAGDVDVSGWKIEDDLLRSIAMENPNMFAECPFLHESLMLESEEQLSHDEKLEAELLYERERKGLLYTPQVPPVESNQAPFGVGNIGLSHIVPTTYSAFPSYLQPALNRMPQMFPAATYAAPMNRMHYQNQLPVTMQHLANRMPMATAPVRPPFSFQMLPPAKTSNRHVNKSNQVVQNRRVTVDENLNLNSVSRPGTKLFIPQGDSVLIVKTAAGGYYLRTNNGQIADANQTKYAQPAPAPHPDEIIELD